MASDAGPALPLVTAAGAVEAAGAPGPRAEPAPPAERSRARAPGGVRELLGFGPGGGAGFGFYAALRRLECRFRDAPRIGEAAHPADEPVRLAQDPSLAFRAQALTAIEDATPGRPPRIAVGFFGAFGPHGPLPTHLTEYADERHRHHADRALIGFFDVFHHRLLSLLFRAWAHAQPAVSHDRPEDDRFARRLGALIGLPPALDGEPFLPLDHACLHVAAHFVGHTRHPEGLAKTLRACFGVPARIEELVGRWLPIPDDACWRIPSGDPRREPAPALGVLGESARVGVEVYDQQSTFCVVLGPLARADYERFLPGSPQLAQLIELVERYAGLDLSWTLRLVLRAPERRAAVLGVEGRLALTAHLAPERDAAHGAFEDLLIDPEQLTSPRTARPRARPPLEQADG